MGAVGTLMMFDIATVIFRETCSQCLLLHLPCQSLLHPVATMRESLQRVKGRLRRALGLSDSAKAASPTVTHEMVEEALTTNLASKPTSRAQTSLSVYTPDPESQLKPGFTRRVRTRLSNRRSLHSLFHNPPLPSNTSIDVTGTKHADVHQYHTTQTDYVFLNLPAEIRNLIYHLLLPDVTNLRDVTGLICACHQIRHELSSMIVAETKPIIEHLKRQSVIRRHIYDSKTNPFIYTPTVSTHTLLRNMNVSIGIGSNTLPKSKRSSVTFIKACTELKGMLRLHLPYVTISAPMTLDTGEDIADPWIRHRFLNECYKSFRRLEEQQDSGFNVQHVIYELGKEKWKGQTWEHPPVIAFVRRKNEVGEVAYEFMGHDPRSEISDYEGVRCDSMGVKELNEVLKKSREAALAGK
jgi:hypothetical protein